MSLVLEASVLVGSGVHLMTRKHLRTDVYDGKGFEGTPRWEEESISKLCLESARE